VVSIRYAKMVERFTWVLLVKDDEETLNEIREFVADWSKKNDSNVKLLGVKGEMEGVRKEGKEGLYVGWL